MYPRILDLKKTLSRKSLFLLGPRQTGKSTYLKLNFPKALYINLLENKQYQLYAKAPEKLHDSVRYFIESGTERTIIIDEVQMVPEILSEVHLLIESEKSLRFILTGSSARKLKRGGANLLGGRASLYHFWPLCFPELKTGGINKWKERLQIGALPSILDSDSPFDDLKDYVGLYLREGIMAEGLTRSINNFSRFLDFAALCNSEQVNYTTLGSDAQISPSVVRDYFEILSDTLIGYSLPAFLATKKRKAVSTAKFYLFDCGVSNAIVGRKHVAEGTPEYGKLLEQAIFIELKTYLDYQRSDMKLEYWRSTSQFEVDFVIYNTVKDMIAIEITAGENPNKKDFKGLFALEEEFKLRRKIVICNASIPQKTKNGIEVLPVEEFLKNLWQGKIIDS